MKTRILLVEDEPGLVLTIGDLLEGEGYALSTANNGISGLEMASTGEFDAIVLDVMLPGKSGFDVCRDLRHKGVDTPVLMLTARAQVVDRVVGLKLGADDYLTKPFDPAELLARVEALLRRSGRGARPAVERFRFGAVSIDFDRAEVLRDGEPVSLAAKELDLLHYLIEHRDRVVPRDEIMRNVWEYSSDASSRTVDTHIAWLRQKLEPEPQSPKHIQTIRGRGYRFTA